MIPQTFAQWRHCIEVDCGIPLTPAYARERVAALTRQGGEEAERFARHYGAQHHARVVGWFQQVAAVGDA
jgi:hypothetical protein